MKSGVIFDFKQNNLKTSYKDLLASLKSPVSLSSKFKSITKSIDKGVVFICDYEGKIHFQHSDYKCFEENQKENNKSILEFIHPEDVFLAIENLVYLLQENAVSVVFEARFLCYRNKYYYTKWHVGYFREMFYFYPLDIPLSKNTPKKNKATAAIKLANKHELFWKKELNKTLAAWDETILQQIKSCTHIKF